MLGPKRVNCYPALYPSFELLTPRQWVEVPTLLLSYPRYANKRLSGRQKKGVCILGMGGGTPRRCDRVKRHGQTRGTVKTPRFGSYLFAILLSVAILSFR